VNKIVKPPGAKPIWGRSATAMAAALLGFREIVPDAPWWASLVLAVVVLVLEQLLRPSQKAAG